MVEQGLVSCLGIRVLGVGFGSRASRISGGFGRSLSD